MQRRHREPARVFARSASASAVLLALAAILAPVPSASAAPGGALSMNPPNNALAIGDTVAITFDVNGGVDLHRVAIGVTYNRSVLQAVDADAGTGGTQILPGSFPGTDIEGAVLQNSVSAGIINYQYELDGVAEVSGDGAIATVQFLAVANGNANLSFSVRTFEDGNAVTHTPSASSAVIAVGAVPTSTPGPTDTALPTDTPGSSETPAATDTPAATSTAGTPTATPTAGSATPTRTATATRTASVTPGPTGTATASTTPGATSTARITVLQNSNDTSAGGAAGVTNGTDPSQTSRANGLPSAGVDTSTIQWWRWTFFAAALMLGFAGWFFTFAVHYGDRDIVLMDRFDVQRRRHSSRKLPRR